MLSQLQAILEDSFVNHMADRFPKDRRMQWLNQNNVGGMGSENINFMINELVRRFASPGIYAEVGILRGRSLVGAALQNTEAQCVGIDNFSEYNPGGQNEAYVKANIAKLKQDNVVYHNADFREAVPDIFEDESVHVYFYDGCHRYQDQLDGLEIMLPKYARKCVIVVDDVCWADVARANDDFVARHPEFQRFIRIAPHDGSYPHGSCNWWNGFEIIYRDG